MRALLASENGDGNTPSSISDLDHGADISVGFSPVPASVGSEADSEEDAGNGL